MPLTLEVQHDVDQMLEHPRPGDGAVLGDMTDEDVAMSSLLRDARSAPASTARIWVTAPAALSTPLAVMVCTESTTSRPGSTASTWVSSAPRSFSAARIERRMHRAGALGPQPHLRRRLLTGDDQRGPTAAGGVAARDLEQQRRLADARLARQQYHRTGHQAAAEHPVELARCRWVGPGARSGSCSPIGWAGR